MHQLSYKSLNCFKIMRELDSIRQFEEIINVIHVLINIHNIKEKTIELKLSFLII